MATTYPSAPSIIINAPGVQSTTRPAPTPVPSSSTSSETSNQSSGSNTSNNMQPSTPTSIIPTLLKNTNLIIQSCYLCDEQNPGDFSPTTKFLDTCLLCSRHFCPIHSSTQWDNVCNINHSQYYHECLEAARKSVASQRHHVDDDDSGVKVTEAEELLIQDGIYPSLGERDKAIWANSPVTDATIREIEKFRSMDAELSGTKGQRRSTLIETRSVVGADIAV